MPQLLQILKTSTIEDFNGDKNMLNHTPRPEGKSLRITDGVVNWNQKIMSEMAPADISLEMITDIPGPKFIPAKAIFDADKSALWTLMQHGVVKGQHSYLACRTTMMVMTSSLLVDGLL